MEKNSRKKLIILAGVTCAGKTHLAKLLKKELGLKEIISYTTRSPRDNEVHGRDYNFVTEEEFIRIKSAFMETESINDYWYGSLKSDYLDKDFVILTPAMALKMELVLDRECLLIFIDCDDDIVFSRLCESDRNDIDSRFARVPKERELMNQFSAVINTSATTKEESFVELKKILDGCR